MMIESIVVAKAVCQLINENTVHVILVWYTVHPSSRLPIPL